MPTRVLAWRRMRGGRLMGSPSIVDRRKWGLDAFLRLDLTLRFLVSTAQRAIKCEKGNKDGLDEELLIDIFRPPTLISYLQPAHPLPWLPLTSG
jgi:hypothetical protein